MRIILAALVLALAAPMAHAQQPDANGFYRKTTDTGCVFLDDAEPSDFQATYIWLGDCQPGQFISGPGSLIMLMESYVDDRGARIQDARMFTGPWVNGLMHGRFKYDNITSVNGGPWTVIPDDCGENWCRGIFFTHNMGVVDYDSAVWGHVDTLQAASAAPAARAPGNSAVSGGTPVQSSRTPVSGPSGSASAFADDQLIGRVSLADIEKLIVAAGFTATPSSKYPGFLDSYHPNGIRFHASGLACQDQTKMLGCAGIYLMVDVSVKTMQTVLQYPDEEVTWEAINRANSEQQLITVFYDQPNNAVKMKRVLFVGDGGQAAANIRSEIIVFPESAKTVIDDYIWPKG